MTHSGTTAGTAGEARVGSDRAQTVAGMRSVAGDDAGYRCWCTASGGGLTHEDPARVTRIGRVSRLRCPSRRTRRIDDDDYLRTFHEVFQVSRIRRIAHRRRVVELLLRFQVPQ